MLYCNPEFSVIIIVPVVESQVGCVVEATTGAFGVFGCGSIVTVSDGADIQPSVFLAVIV